jgi:hypothetical protein
VATAQGTDEATAQGRASDTPERLRETTLYWRLASVRIKVLRQSENRICGQTSLATQFTPGVAHVVSSPVLGSSA